MHGVGCGSARSRPIFKEFNRQGSDSSTDWAISSFICTVVYRHKNPAGPSLMIFPEVGLLSPDIFFQGVNLNSAARFEVEN